VAFSEFAQAVLGHQPTSDKKASLRQEVSEWLYPYHTLMTRALPPNAWGPARLDAVAMIFNRLTGLDLGPLPTHVIAEEHSARGRPGPLSFPMELSGPG
jgi:hypothetical protein